jgi:excisionase family DNA binding protein
MRDTRTRTQPLLLKPGEAAALLGMGRTSFYEHVMPEVRAVRRGRLVLIPRAELESWALDNAARLLG